VIAGRYRFRPGLLVTLAFLAVLPVLLGLGLWQLERAAEKTAIRDRYVARGEMAPVEVGAEPLEAEAMDYRRARVPGRYRPELTIFLDNQVLDGVPGYHVLTPLKIEGARRFMLVNRGWVPWGESRRSLPDIDTPSGALELSGRLREPPEDYFTLEDEPADAGFEKRWQNLDLARYERVTGLSVSPLVLELAPSEQQGGGFVRRPTRYQDEWIQRHKAYAVQWFALALVLVVLYIVLNLKKRDTDSD